MTTTSDDRSGGGGVGDDSGVGAGPALADRSESGVRKRGKKGTAAGMSDRSQAGRTDPKGRSERSFFEVYKPGQGYYTRMGTAVGGALVILFGGHFLWTQLAIFSDVSWGIWVQVGVPLLAVIGLGMLLFWLVGSKRSTSDFFIATEGEMKKVNWSTRKDIIGSTKVVIVFSLAMGTMLFLVDIVCMTFFAWIGVFRGPGIFEMFTGGGG